ncbi:hypothetical protein WG66_001230 [Moniliophthora roreri]|nr:hypothetical protein WG66_001230 [Moniliophthora roreri]
MIQVIRRANYIDHEDGPKVVTYSLGHVPAFTALTSQRQEKITTNITSEVKSPPLNSPSHLGTAWVPATIPVPNEDRDRVPVYGGYIDVTGLQRPVKATYLGVTAALKDRKVLDDTDETFGIPLPTLLTGEGFVQGLATNYTLVGMDTLFCLSGEFKYDRIVVADFWLP